MIQCDWNFVVDVDEWYTGLNDQWSGIVDHLRRAKASEVFCVWHSTKSVSMDSEEVRERRKRRKLWMSYNMYGVFMRNFDIGWTIFG